MRKGIEVGSWPDAVPKKALGLAKVLDVFHIQLQARSIMGPLHFLARISSTALVALTIPQLARAETYPARRS